MVQIFDIDGRVFSFDDEWRVTQFDQWPTYRRLTGPLGAAGCDLVAVHSGTLYLIEAKDYTYAGATPPQDLPERVCRKALDTLALLFALSLHGNDAQEAAFSREAVRCKSIKLCLAVELKDGGRRAVGVRKPLADYKQQIRRLSKSFSDPPVVTSFHDQHGAPWTSSRAPETRSAHRDR